MAPALVLTLFSTSGPIPATAWTDKTNALLPLLAAQLPSLASSPSLRHLDIAASSTYPAHRVCDVLIPLSSSAPPPTQTSCTAAVHALASHAERASLRLTLQPLSPLHRLSNDSAASPPPPPRLALFDIDSTLIQQEVIDELARTNGAHAAVAAITESAMRGDPPYRDDFSASLRARVALLAGIDDRAVWAQLTSTSSEDGAAPAVIQLMPGAAALAACLRSDGWTLGAASGGFAPLAGWVQATLGLQFVEANHLAVDAATGKLTGKLEEGRRIVDGARKREVLLERARELGIDTDAEARNWTLCVGDGSNDLAMMGAAGLGVAFNAKPKVQLQAPAVVNGESLVDVLFVLGWTEEEIKAVTGDAR